MLSREQFTKQLFSLKNQYRQDNAWVSDWEESWTNEDVMTQFILHAYALYAATASNALRLTVLGGTEIRKDEAYVRSFGVTAATGIQEQETRRLVIAESRMRNYRKKYPHPQARNPDRTAVPVTGVGSILSEKGWTPILNDALILGAITGGQDFAVGLTPAEQADWEDMNGSKVNKTATLAVNFDDTAAKNAWKSFFNSQKRMFFFPWGGPRVFTRELLGLSFFGYKPEFSWRQIGFHADKNKRVPPDFRTYLEELRGVEFHQPTNQTKIMKTISTYLFNDPKAIGSPWAENTKTEV